METIGNVHFGVDLDLGGVDKQLNDLKERLSKTNLGLKLDIEGINKQLQDFTIPLNLSIGIEKDAVTKLHQKISSDFDALEPITIKTRFSVDNSQVEQEIKQLQKKASGTTVKYNADIQNPLKKIQIDKTVKNFVSNASKNIISKATQSSDSCMNLCDGTKNILKENTGSLLSSHRILGHKLVEIKESIEHLSKINNKIAENTSADQDFKGIFSFVKSHTITPLIDGFFGEIDNIFIGIGREAFQTIKEDVVERLARAGLDFGFNGARNFTKNLPENMGNLLQTSKDRLDTFQKNKIAERLNETSIDNKTSTNELNPPDLYGPFLPTETTQAPITQKLDIVSNLLKEIDARIYVVTEAIHVIQKVFQSGLDVVADALNEVKDAVSKHFVSKTVKAFGGLIGVIYKTALGAVISTVVRALVVKAITKKKPGADFVSEMNEDISAPTAGFGKKLSPTVGLARDTNSLDFIKKGFFDAIRGVTTVSEKVFGGLSQSIREMLPPTGVLNKISSLNPLSRNIVNNTTDIFNTLKKSILGLSKFIGTYIIPVIPIVDNLAVKPVSNLVSTAKELPDRGRFYDKVERNVDYSIDSIENADNLKPFQAQVALNTVLENARNEIQFMKDYEKVRNLSAIAKFNKAIKDEAARNNRTVDPSELFEYDSKDQIIQGDGKLAGVDNLDKIKDLEKKITISIDEGEIKELRNQIEALKSFSAGYGKDLKQIESDIFEKVKASVNKFQSADLVLDEKTGKFSRFNSTAVLKKMADVLAENQNIISSILDVNKAILAALNGGKIIEIPSIESAESSQINTEMLEVEINEDSINQLSFLLKKLISILSKTTGTPINQIVSPASNPSQEEPKIEGIIDFEDPSQKAIKELSDVNIESFTEDNTAPYQESLVNFVKGIKGFNRKSKQLINKIKEKVNKTTFNKDDDIFNEIVELMGKLEAQGSIALEAGRKNKDLAVRFPKVGSVDGKSFDKIVGNGFKSSIADKIKSLKKILKDNFDIDDSLAQKIDESMKQVGSQVGEGFKNGLDAYDLNKIALGIVDPIKKTINRSLGIASPSKWAHQVGQFLMQGLGGGIEDGLKYVEESIDALINKIKNKFENIVIPDIQLVPSIDLNIFESLGAGVNAFALSTEQASLSIATSIGNINESFKAFSIDSITKVNNTIANFKLPNIDLLEKLKKGLIAIASPFVKTSNLIKRAITSIKDSFQTLNTELKNNIENVFANFELPKIDLVPNFNVGVFGKVGRVMESVSNTVERTADDIDAAITKVNYAFFQLNKSAKEIEDRFIRFYRSGVITVKVLNRIYNAAFVDPPRDISKEINQQIDGINKSVSKSMGSVKPRKKDIIESGKDIKNIAKEIREATRGIEVPRPEMPKPLTAEDRIANNIFGKIDETFVKIEKKAKGVGMAITAIAQGFYNVGMVGVEALKLAFKTVKALYKTGKVIAKVFKKIHKAVFPKSVKEASKAIRESTKKTVKTLSKQDKQAESIYQTLEKVAQATKAIAMGFVNVGKLVADAIGYFINFSVAVYDFGNETGKATRQVAENLKHVLVEAKQIFDKVDASVGAFGASIENTVQRGKDQFISFTTAIKNFGISVKNTAQQMVTDFKESFAQILDNVKQTFEQAGDVIKNKIGGTFQQGKNNESKMRDKVFKSFGVLSEKDDLAGKFFDIVGDKQDITKSRDKFIKMLKAGEIGKEIVAGLLEGVDPKVIDDIAKTSALGFMIQMERVLGIQSPSKWAMGVGGYIVKGLNKGIVSGQGTLEKSTGQIKETVAKVFDKIPDSTESLSRAIASDVKDINKNLATGSMSLLDVIDLSQKETSKGLNKIPKSTKKLNKAVAKDIEKINKILTRGGSVSLLDAIAIANKEAGKEFKKIPGHTKRINKEVSRDVLEINKTLKEGGSTSFLENIQMPDIQKIDLGVFGDIKNGIAGIAPSVKQTSNSIVESIGNVNQSFKALSSDSINRINESFTNVKLPDINLLKKFKKGLVSVASTFVKVSNVIKKSIANVNNSFKALTIKIKTNIENILSGLNLSKISLLPNINIEAFSKIRPVMESVSNTVKDVVGNINTSIAKVSLAFSRLNNTAKDVANGFIKFYKAGVVTIKVLKKISKAAFAASLNNISKKSSEIEDRTEKSVGKIKIPKSVINAFKSLKGNSKQTTASLSELDKQAESIYNTLKSVAKTTKTVAKGLFKIGKFVVSTIKLFIKLINTTKQVITAIKNGFGDASARVKQMATDFKESFIQMIEAVKQSFGNISGIVKNKLNDTIKIGQNQGAKFSNKIRSVFNFMPKKEKLADQLYDLVGDKQTITKSKKEFIKIVKSGEIGKEIIAGLLDGIDDSAVEKVANKTAHDFMSELEEVLEIKSPSKWAIGVGGYIVTGLVQGVTNGQNPIEKAARQIKETAVEAFDKIPEATKRLNKAIASDVKDIDKTLNTGSMSLLEVIALSHKRASKSFDKIPKSTKKLNKDIARDVSKINKTLTSGGSMSLLDAIALANKEASKNFNKIPDHTKKLNKNVSKDVKQFNKLLNAKGSKSIADAIAKVRKNSQAQFSEIPKTVKGIGQKTIDTISSELQGKSEDIKKTVGNIGEEATKGLSSLAESTKGTGQGIVTNLSAEIRKNQNKLEVGINQVVASAYKKLDYMADTGTNAGKGLVDNIKSAIQKNTASLTSVVYKAKNKVGKGINKISNFTRRLGKDIDAHVKKIGKTFNSGQSKSLTGVISRARKKAGGEIQKLSTYTEKVNKAIAGHVANIDSTFNKSGSKSLAGAIARVRKNASKELSELPKSVAGAGTATVERLQSEIKEANKDLTAAISQSRQKAIEELSSNFDTTDIKDNSFIENLRSGMESGAVALSRSAAMLKEGVTDELSRIPKATEELSSNIADNIADIDQNLKKSKIAVIFDKIKNKLTNGTGEIKDIFGALVGFVASFSIASYLNNQLISLSTMSFDTGVAFDALTDKMRRFLGTTEEVDDKIKELRKSSKALGLDQMVVLENYTELYQTLKNTPLEGMIDPISKSLNKAAKAFSLATEDLKGMYDEIKDITIRGLIDKEAIEGLSRVIPGATQIAAKSLNITEQELRALSSQNLINTSSFLPNFMRQLDVESMRAIANSSGTVRFEMNKLKNTVQDMTITLGNNFLPLARIVFKTVNAGVMVFSNQVQSLLEIFNINKIVGMFNGLTKAVGLFAALKAIPWLAPLFAGINKLLTSSVTYLGTFLVNLVKLKGMSIILGFLKNTLFKTVVIVEAVTFAFNTLRTILGSFNLSDNPLIAKQTVWDDLSKKISKITSKIRKDLKKTEESIRDVGNAPSKYFKPEGLFEKSAAAIVDILPFVPDDLPSFASMRRDNYMKGLQEHIADLDEKLKTSEMINQIGQAKNNAGVLAEVKQLDDEILKLTAKRTAARGTDRAKFTKEIEEIREKREALAADFVAFGVGYQELLATIESELEKKKDDPELVDRLENAKSSIGGVIKLVKDLESQNGAISYLKKFSNALIKLEFSFESLSKTAERARNNLDLGLLQNQIQQFQTNYFSEAQSSLKRSAGELDILKKEYEESIKSFKDITVRLQATPQYEEILSQIAEREEKAGRTFNAADIGAMIKDYANYGDQGVIQILEAEQQLRDKQLDLEQKNKAILEQELNVLSDKERLSLEELDRYRTIQENQNRIKDSVERSQISQLTLKGLDASVIGIRQTVIDKKSLERQLKLNQDIEARLNQEAANGTLRAQEYTNRIEELKTSRQELEQQLLDAEVQAQSAQQQRFITQTDRSNEQRQADLSIARLKDETKAAIAHAELLKQDLTPAEIEYRKALTDSSLQISSLQDDILAKQDLIAQIVNSGFDTEETRERLRGLNNEVKQQQAELDKLQLETEQQNATALSSKILDDVDRATQRLQHLSDINVANIELDNLRKYNQDLLNAPNYIAEFNKSMADMQMSVLGVENSLYRAQKALKDLEESEVNTPDSRARMKELRREIETLEIERAKAIEQQQIDSRNAQSQLFSDRLNEIRSLKEFENNISRIKDQINVNSFGLFGEDLINKKDIENQLKLAKTIKQEIEKGFSQGALSTIQYKEEIRQATTALYDLELQLVNVNKQLFNQKLAELRSVSEFEANIKKVKAQIELAGSGVTEDIFQFNTQMLDRDSINSQLEMVTKVRGEIEKAFSQGIISVSEYNQEIRQATQQQYDLELQLINIGRQFQTQLEKPIDKINRKLEKQKRLLDNRNNILSEEKALQEAISNTTIARLNKELEVNDKIKSLMDELSSNTLSLMIRQQEKRLRISQKELKSIEDRFYAEEKSLALTREREILENKQEKARVKNDITTQQKLLEAAEQSGNKDAIALYREKVRLANEELRNLIEQDRVNARINSKRRSVLAMNSQSEIQLKQITNQSLVYEQSLERLKYITGDITKQLDKQKNSLQSHKDLTDAIANYRQSLGDIDLQSTNVAKDLISQLKSEDITQGLKTELENQLSVLGFNPFDKEIDLMIDALKMETNLSKDRVNLLKSQHSVARSMLEIDLQRASIEAKQAVVQAKLLAMWSKALGMSDEDSGNLVKDASEAAIRTERQGEMARRALDYNQASEMNRLRNDNFLKELESRRAIAGREDFVRGSLPRMSERPEPIRLKIENIKPPKIDTKGLQQSLDDFKMPLEGMNNKLHNEVQITNSILSNIELAITGQRSIDTNIETNKETENQLKLGYLEEVRKTNNILQETSNSFGEMQKLTKDIVGSDNGMDLKRLGYLVEESINTDPQIEIKDSPVSKDIYRESKKTNTLLEGMSKMMMQTNRASSNNNQKNVNVKEINLVSKDTNSDLRDLMSKLTMQF